MKRAVEQASPSPAAPTKFCAGAVLINTDKNEVLSTEHSKEMPEYTPTDVGRTHAEQCCFIKVAQKHNLPEERIGKVLPENTVLCTSMKPCNKIFNGNRTCVERILRLNRAIKVV